MDAKMRSEVVTLKPATARGKLRHRFRGDVSLLQLLGQSCLLLALLAGSYFFFSHFVMYSVTVLGSSMQPTLHEEDFYLVNKIECFWRAPDHGDIVVLKDPTDQAFVVKRVVGAAGDTIELRDGLVYLNGRRLHEPYLSRGMRTLPCRAANQVIRLGPGQYFVLGDNRVCSSDSRVYGAVPRSAILGFVMR